MLPSARVRRAPNFLSIPMLTTAREMPVVAQPHSIPLSERVIDFGEEANDLQVGLAMGLTRWADRLHGTTAANDPSLPLKLKNRMFLIPHVIEEVHRIKAKN
jgi:hypothetical protein